MPTYEFRCENCSHQLEKFQYFSEEPLTKCPSCYENALKKVISGGLGFSIKGGSCAHRAEAMGGRYIPMDSAEQKFESRMQELKGNDEI